MEGDTEEAVSWISHESALNKAAAPPIHECDYDNGRGSIGPGGFNSDWSFTPVIRYCCLLLVGEQIPGLTYRTLGCLALHRYCHQPPRTELWLARPVKGETSALTATRSWPALPDLLCFQQQVSFRDFCYPMQYQLHQNPKVPLGVGCLSGSQTDPTCSQLLQYLPARAFVSCLSLRL